MQLLVSLTLLFALLILGIPVAFSLMLAGTVGIILAGSFDLLLASLNTIPYSSLGSYELITIPLFILMAEFMVVSGIANSLFEAIAVWTRRSKTGLGAATALTGAAFGALSGSSVAAAATLASVTVPSMRANGYDAKFAAGIAAISGGLAMLIPPSIVIIIYGILTETDIAQLLIAGIIPGIILALIIILAINLSVYFQPSLIKKDKESLLHKSRLESLKVIWPFLILFGLVTGVIYTGIATPVEASALGALGALVLCLSSKRLTWTAFWLAIRNSIITTAMIAFILVGAGFFGLFITLTGVTQSLLSILADSSLNGTVIVFVIAIIYLILGLFLDTITILVLTLPIVHPIIAQYGFDMIWFGIIAILLVETGLITPPLGLNVFVVAKVSRLPVVDVFRGTIPFILAQLFAIVLFIVFPSIILWLPLQMR